MTSRSIGPVPPLRRRTTACVLVAAGVALAGLTTTGLTELRLPSVMQPPESPRSALPMPAPPSAGPTPGRPVMAGPGWHVTDRLSVDGILIVTVETERSDRLVPLARTVAAPALRDHYEVLVYFRRPGATHLTGRVRWTPADGYIALMF